MNNTTSILSNAFAFWRPAVKLETSLVEGTRKEVIDQTSINIRVGFVAISTFALLVRTATSLAPLEDFMLLGTHNFIGTLSACALGITAVYERFEGNRAQSKIINDLLTTLIPSISTDKQAVATLLAYGKTSIVKNFLKSDACTDNYKQELLEYSLPKKNELLTKNLPKGDLRLFKLLISTGIKFNENHIDLIISDFNFLSYALDILSYVLEKKTPHIENLTNDQQFKILSEAHSSAELEFLIENKFDIDVKNSHGSTILLNAIISSGTFEGISTGFSSSKKLCLALKHGAKIPANDTVIMINDTEKMQLGEYLEDKPMTRAILEKAKKRNSEESEVCPLKSDVSVWNLKKPILTLDRFNRSVFGRITTVALSTLVLGLGFALATRTPLPFLSLLAVPLYYKYEWSRTTNKINTLVLTEFINAKFPRKEAFQYILNDETLLDKLLDDRINLLTFSDEGIPFYEYILTGMGRYGISDERKYSYFTQMTDVFFTRGIPKEQKYFYLKCAVESKKLGYIEYIVKNKYVSTDDLTEIQKKSWPKDLKGNIKDLLCKNGLKI